MTALATESRVWHEQDIDAVATRMATDPERRLSTAEGERRLRDVGPNELHTLTLGQLAVGAGLALGILVLMEIDKTLRRRSRQRAPQAQRTGRRPCVIPTGATYTARPFVAAGGRTEPCLVAANARAAIESSCWTPTRCPVTVRKRVPNA